MAPTLHPGNMLQHSLRNILAALEPAVFTGPTLTARGLQRDLSDPHAALGTEQLPVASRPLASQLPRGGAGPQSWVVPAPVGAQHLGGMGEAEGNGKARERPHEWVPEPPVQGCSLQSPLLGEGPQPSLHSPPPLCLSLSPRPTHPTWHVPPLTSLGEGSAGAGAWREEGAPAPHDLRGGARTSGAEPHSPPREAAHSTDEGKLMDKRKGVTPIIQTGKKHRKRRF